jgi:hypothetical protein
MYRTVPTFTSPAGKPVLRKVHIMSVIPTYMHNYRHLKRSIYTYMDLVRFWMIKAEGQGHPIPDQVHRVMIRQKSKVYHCLNYQTYFLPVINIATYLYSMLYIYYSIGIKVVS